MEASSLIPKKVESIATMKNNGQPVISSLGDPFPTRLATSSFNQLRRRSVPSTGDRKGPVMIILALFDQLNVEICKVKRKKWSFSRVMKNCTI